MRRAGDRAPAYRKMARAAYRTKPGEFEIRIGPDGRVHVLAPDERMLDLVAAVSPDSPVVRKRRKAKARAQSRTAEARRRAASRKARA